MDEPVPHLYHGPGCLAVELGERGWRCNDDSGANAMDATGQISGGSRNGVESKGCAGGECGVSLHSCEKVRESVGGNEDVLGGELFGFGKGCDGGGNTSDYIFVGELNNLNLSLILHIGGAECDNRRCLQVNLATVCDSWDFDYLVIHRGLDLGSWR